MVLTMDGVGGDEGDGDDEQQRKEINLGIRPRST